MDQTQQPVNKDWKELNVPHQIIADDIIKQLSLVGPQAYPHQYEFLQYLLGQQKQLPLIALKSQTGSGKTLCFQTILYQNYDAKVHSQIYETRMIKGVEKRMLTPYALVMGNTIFLKQHEEVFRKYIPERLQKDGLKFQTFYALGKGAGEKQFDIPENRIENAEAQVLLCHPSKMMAALKMGILGCKNLRYLIIDEADDLLKNDSSNLARRDVKDILSYVMGQRGEELKFQIIFVSATLKTEDIQELVFDCIQKNFENDKKIDKRFYTQVGDTKEPLVDIKIIPSGSSDLIAPYQIRHFYYEPKEKKIRKNFLAQLIKKIYDKVDSIQVMVFFNTKIGTKKIFEVTSPNIQLLKEFEKLPELKFLVEKNLIVFCTGDSNQVVREEVRKDFSTQKKKILLCTDVLQRGLDFRKVRLIIHYGLPKDPASKFAPEIYFQRSGRTGRAQDEGAVITLLGQKDRKDRKKEMVDYLTKKHCKIEEYREATFIEDINTVLQFDQHE